MIVTSGANAGTYWYHSDALGSVIALSKFDSGAASFVEKYTYSAFGETTVTLNGNTGNPYRFTGREYDSETGLYYYRARMYSPQIGRFLQPDPIGYGDGMNRYAYVGNNPLGFADPTGLCKEGYGVRAALSGFGNTIAARIDNFMKTSPMGHLKNLYNDMYGFGEMFNQTMYDIGYDPGSVYDTLYEFGYMLDEIYLDTIANKTDYELGAMIGNLTLDAEIAAVFNRAIKNYGNTEIGTKSVATSSATNPVTTSPRVGSALKKDPYHSFPDVVDNYATSGTQTTLNNGATLYQIEGSLNGVDGRFEFILDGGNVTHRFFVKGGTINGIPTKP